MVGQGLLHYRVTEKIGEGGMGAVYKALDTHLDRPVAIKVLPPDKVSDPERKRRFVLEARAASALRHPNIVVIHDIASDGGRDFIVMEFVEGSSLDALIGRKGLKLNEALGYAVQIADGLAKAHAAGIIHRDLKPTNIMVTTDGVVKILDFGLAKLGEAVPDSGPGPTRTLDRDGKPRTEAGFVVGTAAYMSPEQAEGGKVDARSDIFSFGAVLYEMLTGRKAFGRESAIKTLAAVLNEEPKPPSSVTEGIPAELERVVVRCLRKDPQRRWQTMSDLKVALQDIKEDSESGRLTAAAGAVRPARKRMRTLGLAAASVLVIAAAAVGIKLFLLKPPGPVEYEISPMTFDSGVTAFQTLSPDGSLMAYTSDREGNGNLDIWVQQISGGKPLRLTNHPADDWFPCFSPDGSQIVFRSERDGGGVYIIDALGTGGEARRVADRGFLPRFSPDGRWISYQVLPASLELNQYKTFLVSPKGGEPRRILADFTFGFMVHGAALVWSPDAKNLLFRGRRMEEAAPGKNYLSLAVQTEEAKTTDWWVAPIDGTRPIRTHAVENLGLKTIVQFPVAWVGNSIYYVSGTTIEGVNLFRASIDPKTRAITGPAEAVTTGAGMKLYPTVMTDGRVFFSQMTVAMNAWTAAARPDEGVVTGRPEKLSRDLMQNFDPTISRDGAKAAYSAFGGAQGAGRVEVRVKDLKSGEETRIPLQGLSVSQFPRLSPDGSILSFIDIIDGKRKAIVVAPGVASGRELCENCDVFGFSPDDRFALVRNQPGRLEMMDVRTGQKRVILSSAMDIIEDAGLSPDAKWISWLAGEPDGRASVRISPIEGGSTGLSRSVTIAQADYYLGSPAWSPDGRWLYYLSEKNGRCSLFARRLDPRTKEPAGPELEVFSSMESRLMLNFPKGNGMIGVAKDRIVFEATVLTGNIYLAKPKNR